MGLCYNYDEPYVFGHMCKNMVNYLMMTKEEELLNAQENTEWDSPQLEVQISMQSMMG